MKEETLDIKNVGLGHDDNDDDDDDDDQGENDEEMQEDDDDEDEVGFENVHLLDYREIKIRHNSV